MLSIADILWCVNVDPLKVEDELTKKGFWLSDQPVDRPQSLFARLGQPGSWRLLTPSEHHAARPNTFSGIHGLGVFPWHTDGAIAVRPPRYLVLLGGSESQAATEIADLDSRPLLVKSLTRVVLRTTADFGRMRYVSAVERTDSRLRFRWDPDKLKICSPGDGPPVELVQPCAAVTWTTGKLLIVDNWRCLHRRQAVKDGDERVLRRLYIYT